MVPSRPGCAPPPPAARSSSRPTASCRATSSCTRTCCVTDLLRLVRINNLLLAAAGVLAGGWIALGAVRTPNVLALAAVAAVGVAMAGNVLNDIWDQAADRVNRSRGERPLATGRVTRGTADLCVASGAVIGLGAAAFVNGTAVLVVLGARPASLVAAGLAAAFVPLSLALPAAAHYRGAYFLIALFAQLVVLAVASRLFTGRTQGNSRLLKGAMLVGIVALVAGRVA